MRRLTVPQYILDHNKPAAHLLASVARIKAGISRLSIAEAYKGPGYSSTFRDLSHLPESDVSVIIPAYNEEQNILKTLSSLSASTTGKTVEVIVVDNNSADQTAYYATTAGAICIREPVQGITPARNCGLAHARGRYILNADADTIYPPQWIDLMIEPLSEQSAAMVYGDHYFLPSGDTGRLRYLLYEHFADLKKWRQRRFGEEAVNVYGFNSAFIREEGLMVEGFNHPPGTNEDGWLAVKLRNRFKRKLFHQSNPQSMPWTSDRRLMIDGGVVSAAVKRVRGKL